MTNATTILARIKNLLGPALYKAATTNDLPRLKSLTNPNTDAQTLAQITIATIVTRSSEITSHCLEDGCRQSGVIDSVLRWIAEYESLDPIYHFLVDSNFVDVNWTIDRTGSLLGILAGGKGRDPLIQYLLQNSANTDERPEIEGGMCSPTAAAGHSSRQRVEALLDHGARIRGTGALIFAAQCGKVETVKLLLERGADVNEMVPLILHSSSEENMGPALHKAVQSGHVDVVDVLVEAGADVTMKDARGRTAREIAVQKRLDDGVVAKLS